MANEITLKFSLQVENGFLKQSVNIGQLQVDQAAAGMAGGAQEIGTSEEVVDFGDVSTEGLLFLRNLDDTNYIEFGPEDTGAMVAVGKLEPGEFAFFRVKPSVVLRAQADAAACLLQVLLLED